MSDFVHPRSVNAESTLPTSRLEVGKPRVTFEEVRDGRRVNRIWVEDRLDHEWVAVYCLVAKNGRLVIAEPKLCPYEENARPGEWSDASVPDDGLPFDKLRELHTDSTLKDLRAFLEYVEDECNGGESLERVFSRFELDHGLVLSEGIPHRQRRARADVARAAAVYARTPRASRGDRIKAVADEIPCVERTAYRLIGDAREHGFLDGDELTDRARQFATAKTRPE